MLTQERYDRMAWVSYGNEREKKGEKNMLVRMVKKGRLTIEEAAEEANMFAQEFKDKHMKSAYA